MTGCAEEMQTDCHHVVPVCQIINKARDECALVYYGSSGATCCGLCVLFLLLYPAMTALCVANQ